MSLLNVVLVMIGQIGAGKSSVCTHLVTTTGALHFSLDNFRQQRTDGDYLSRVADEVSAKASSTLVILECTGASRDFEDLVEKLRIRSIECYVVLLECTLATAMHRVRNRDGRDGPRGGGSWGSQLRWTEARLQLIPVDLTISSEKTSPIEIASVIHRDWEVACRRVAERSEARLIDKVSFSQLATFQVCPLSYRLKYEERRPEMAESEEMYLGRLLHDTLAWLYGAIAQNPSKNETIQWFYNRVAETLPGNVGDCIKERLCKTGGRALKYHYDVVFLNEKMRTVAVEKTVKMELKHGLMFVGRVDRIALDPTGVLEVIDYKTSLKVSTSRPRIPEWLQIAAYSAAVLREFNLQSVIARRIVLQTGSEERLAVGVQDARQVTLSLQRWLRRLTNSGSFPGNTGAHCASCQFNLVCPEDTHPPLARNAIRHGAA